MAHAVLLKDATSLLQGLSANTTNLLQTVSSDPSTLTFASFWTIVRASFPDWVLLGIVPWLIFTTLYFVVG
jgi:hypothetical protein